MVICNKVPSLPRRLNPVFYTKSLQGPEHFNPERQLLNLVGKHATPTSSLSRIFRPQTRMYLDFSIRSSLYPFIFAYILDLGCRSRHCPPLSESSVSFYDNSTFFCCGSENTSPYHLIIQKKKEQHWNTITHRREVC